MSCLSQLSIKTRIETPDGWEKSHRAIKVWVSYPLKQGLKHDNGKDLSVDGNSLSQLSIKTRIETKNASQADLVNVAFESAIH